MPALLALALLAPAAELGGGGDGDAIDRLHNRDVWIALSMFARGPRLTYDQKLELRAAARRRGPAKAVARLRAMLTDRDRYAAAHLALVDLVWVGLAPPDTLPDGQGRVEYPIIYEPWGWPELDLVEPGERIPPPEWAGRRFHYGLEWGWRGSGKEATAEIRPAETMARLDRYWREYFAGERTDFSVQPSDPDYWWRPEPGEPRPVRPADDPRPSAADWPIKPAPAPPAGDGDGR